MQTIVEGANEGKDMRRRNRMKPRKEAITVPVSELGSKPNNCQASHISTRWILPGNGQLLRRRQTTLFWGAAPNLWQSIPTSRSCLCFCPKLTHAFSLQQEELLFTLPVFLVGNVTLITGESQIRDLFPLRFHNRSQFRKSSFWGQE